MCGVKLATCESERCMVGALLRLAPFSWNAISDKLRLDYFFLYISVDSILCQNLDPLNLLPTRRSLFSYLTVRISHLFGVKPASTMDTSTRGKSTNNTNQAVHHNSPPASTGGEAQMTEYPDETPNNGKDHAKLPQELLDLIWNFALEPWLKKRVMVLHCFYWTADSELRLHFLFGFGNPTDSEARELVGNIRLVNRKARGTVSLSLSKVPRDMFPERPAFSRRFVGESLKEQHPDFQHDIFWLSRTYINARFSYISYDRKREVHPDMLSLEPPQPSHMMLSLRHMLALMQMVFVRDTPCLGRHQLEPTGYDDPLRDFHRVVQINRAGRLRTLTVLLPQSIDEWNGEVEYELLEHRPFGTSVEKKNSVLELARNQSNRSLLEKTHIYWSNLTSLAEKRGVDLPVLQFSRRRS